MKDFGGRQRMKNADKHNEGFWRVMEDLRGSGGFWRVNEDNGGFWKVTEENGGIWRAIEDFGW